MALGFTRHARKKMRQLGLTIAEIADVIEEADVIEHYPDREGLLLYGRVRTTELHVSLVRRKAPPITLVATVYEVDRAVFPDGRNRRSSR